MSFYTNSNCIIVIGCYRTGSSAIAGILQYLGVYMGNYFDLPSYANPKGYFEDLEFKKFHKFIEKYNKIPEGYYQLIKSRELENKIWGVKDPLLCFYLQHLTNAIKYNHMVINCNRPLQEIASSAFSPNSVMQKSGSGLT
jgi:hypothetical protein